MLMTVMPVGVMQMLMPNPRVPVPVAMRLSGRIGRCMVVPVMDGDVHVRTAHASARGSAPRRGADGRHTRDLFVLEFGMWHGLTAVTEPLLKLILTRTFQGQEAHLRLELEAIKLLCHDSKSIRVREGNHLYRSSLAQNRQNTERGERRVVLVNTALSRHPIGNYRYHDSRSRAATSLRCF